MHCNNHNNGFVKTEEWSIPEHNSLILVDQDSVLQMCFDGRNKNISLKDSTFPKQVANLITVRDSGDILEYLSQFNYQQLGILQPTNEGNME